MKKILFVGYGSIGTRHINNILKSTNHKIIIYTKRTDLKSLNNKRIKIFNSLDEALSENPNVGFVTNETSFHVDTAIKLAKKGLDLFIEKPLSHSMKGIKQLETIAKKKKLITMVGCNMRFYPPLVKIKNYLEKNSLGRIISVQVDSGSFLPDWHPYEDYRLGYAARKDLGGGIVLTSIHEIDYLHWFFGKVDGAFSITGKFSDLEVSADDLSAILLKFHNNIVGEVHLDYIQRPYFKSCKIKGTKGILYWNSDENLVKIFDYEKKTWKIIFNAKNHILSSPKQSNYMYKKELSHFLKCIDQRKETINSLSNAVKSLEIALAIKKSSELKKMIYIK